jgi:hypothetical protein
MEILDLPGGTKRPRAKLPLGPDFGGGGQREGLCFKIIEGIALALHLQIVFVKCVLDFTTGLSPLDIGSR